MLYISKDLKGYFLILDKHGHVLGINVKGREVTLIFRGFF
jgi:hypothetical protein